MLPPDRPSRGVAPDEVRAARRELGLTQASLAALLGVDPSTIRRWEMPRDKRSSVTIPSTARAAIRAMRGTGLRGRELAAYMRGLKK